MAEKQKPQLSPCNYLIRGGSCDVPESVAACPECSGKLFVDCDEWRAATGMPTESGISVSCYAEEEAMDIWMHNDDDDRDMREVGHRWWQSDWQPIKDRVWKWICSELGGVE